MNLLPNPDHPLALLAFWESAAFTSVFLLTAIGILLIPKRLIEQEDSVPSWWRNVRFWAVAICAVQMLVYWTLG